MTCRFRPQIKDAFQDPGSGVQSAVTRATGPTGFLWIAFRVLFDTETRTDYSHPLGGARPNSGWDYFSPETLASLCGPVRFVRVHIIPSKTRED
jgi:hypothetical protein